MKIHLWLLHLMPQENALAFLYLLELGARRDLSDIPPRPGAVDKCVQGQANPGLDLDWEFPCCNHSGWASACRMAKTGLAYENAGQYCRGLF